MSAADKAWRTVGFVGEVSAVVVAGLFELLSPRDKSGEHFGANLLGVRDNIAMPVSTSTPQPSPVTTHTSAGDSSAAAGTLPPTAAAEPLTWLGWAVPAICEVLAEHEPRTIYGVIACGDHAAFVTHCDWSEHVAPLIAERIACNPARAIAALENFQPK